MATRQAREDPRSGWVDFDSASFQASVKNSRRKSKSKSKTKRREGRSEKRHDHTPSRRSREPSAPRVDAPAAERRGERSRSRHARESAQSSSSSSRSSRSTSRSRKVEPLRRSKSQPRASIDAPPSPEAPRARAPRRASGNGKNPPNLATSSGSESSSAKSSSRPKTVPSRASSPAPRRRQPLSRSSSMSRDANSSSSGRRDPSGRNETPELRPRSRSRPRQRSSSSSAGTSSNNNINDPPSMRSKSRTRQTRPPMTMTGRGRNEEQLSTSSRERSRSRPRTISQPARPTPTTPNLGATTRRGRPPVPRADDPRANDNENHTDSEIESCGRAMVPRRGSRREGGVMEKLFGDQIGERVRARSRDPTLRAQSKPDRIHPRILLSATVYHNAATNLWITTINTNQKGVATNPTKASKYLKAFSFPSESEARESAIANAPPKMLAFEDHPNCYVCNGKFAVFRRACHCRNCGVAVCGSCTTVWPHKSIPETYNLKKESNVKVCVTCDTLALSFKRALLKGDYDDVLRIYGTGNINLRTPFTGGRGHNGEIMFPIHCAVEGGNLNVLRWLTEEHFCPIKKVGNGNSRKRRGQDYPILTSKGRSALSIAMSGLKVDILRYLVIEKNLSVHDTRDLNVSLRALEAVLLALPSSKSTPIQGEIAVPRWAKEEYYDDDEESSVSSFRDGVGGDNSTIATRQTSEQLNDVCIICYDNPIDCVLTPCGHQICCLECSANMKACPVCNTDCQVIRIFKP